MPIIPLRYRRPSILLIGSIHIDTVAERDDTDVVDVRGPVIQSIGGSAYNIAANLGRMRARFHGPVYLFAFLPKTSALTSIIRGKLRALTISRQFITFRDYFDSTRITIGGFVGLRSSTSKDMIKAATQTAIQEITPFSVKKYHRKFKRALARVRCVVTDTNINEPTMEKVVALSHQKGKPLFVAIVSEDKASILSDIYNQTPPPSKPIHAVSGRIKELCKILGAHPQADAADIAHLYDTINAGHTTIDRPSPAQICSWARARHVIVTPNRKSDCCFVFSAAGTSLHFNPISGGLPKDGNYTGLGDAILAGLVHVFMRQPLARQTADHLFDLVHPETISSIIETVRDFTCDVVRVQGATPYSVISFSEEDVPLSSRLMRYGNKVIGFIRDNWQVLTIFAGLVLAWLGFDSLNSLLSWVRSYIAD